MDFDLKVFLTGATGFVGSALLNRFVADNFNVTALVRNVSIGLPGDVTQVVGDLSSFVEDENGLPRGFAPRNDEGDQIQHDKLFSILSHSDVVVHTAARAHIMRDEAVEPLVEYRGVNRDATLALAGLAAKAGVKRFVFISSIGVNGSITKSPFTELDRVSPHNDYALSKYEAETGLLQMAEETGMEVVIIRPPLVYGSNAPGNFGSLVKWVKRSVPLPLGVVNNKRSLIALDNLVDFIALCADREKSSKAANQVFLISDADDVSTSELLRKVAKAYGIKSCLLPVPVGLMRFVAKILGKGAVADRLFGNLQVDSSKARDLLGWHPVVKMDEQLAKMVAKEKEGV